VLLLQSHRTLFSAILFLKGFHTAVAGSTAAGLNIFKLRRQKIILKRVFSWFKNNAASCSEQTINRKDG
jgi:hypothetical protein